MKELGIIRIVDSLGRIVIPSSARKHHNWEPGTEIEMLDTEDGLFLRSYKLAEKKQAAIDTLYDVIQTSEDRQTIERLHDVLEYIEDK